MSHGNRWEVVAAGASMDAFGHYLPLIVQKGAPVIGQRLRFAWPSEDGRDGEAVETASLAMVYAEGPFAFCTILVHEPKRGGYDIMTAFPTPIASVEQRLIVRDVREDCGGLEGWIDAEWESNQMVSFFAIDYFVNSRRYAKGATIHARLSALAYAMEPAVARKFDIDLSKLTGRLKDLGLPMAGENSMRVTTKGAAILAPIPDWEPFEYVFQGPLTRRESFMHQDRQFHQLTITVARPGDGEFELPVLTSQHAFQGQVPDVGADLSGTLCMMGRMADFAWPPPPRLR